MPLGADPRHYKRKMETNNIVAVGKGETFFIRLNARNSGGRAEDANGASERIAGIWYGG